MTPSAALTPVTLRGDHVRLEPLAREHTDALAAVGLDPDLWRLTTRRVETRDDLVAYVEEALAAQADGTALPFATVEAPTGTVVGCTRLGNYAPEHRRVEIGWTWVAAPWQRSAVNTEAKLLLLRHAFETLGCHRVELKTDARNERSRRAILRLGATEEGRLRKHMATESGHLRDTLYFSILDDEWPDVESHLTDRLSR